MFPLFPFDDRTDALSLSERTANQPQRRASDSYRKVSGGDRLRIRLLQSELLQSAFSRRKAYDAGALPKGKETMTKEPAATRRLTGPPVFMKTGTAAK